MAAIQDTLLDLVKLHLQLANKGVGRYTLTAPFQNKSICKMITVVANFEGVITADIADTLYKEHGKCLWM